MRYAGIGLLLLQLAAIVRGRISEDRYFCWAPFDRQTRYSIGVTVGGEPLSGEQVRQRYRRAAVGVDNRSEHHIFDIIRRAEQRLDLPARGRVTVAYSMNGHPERVWRYPE
ncbi:MAG: hypothetical protein FJW30_14155 [Acidobacteria bacterium]|nr:hypothetical protein [Acidobacteriota bacterium]